MSVEQANSQVNPGANSGTNSAARAPAKPPTKRKRRSWAVGILMLAVALAVLARGGRYVYSTASIGAGYVAKHTCSCMFVVGRTAQSCSQDYDAQAARLLSVQTAQRSVTVTGLAGLLSARAEFETGFGCHLVN